MDTSTRESYTAKLTDGPLEGKTLSTAFTESGQPRSQVSITGENDKRYIYSYAAGLEFDGEDDERPTAANYHYVETVFD